MAMEAVYAAIFSGITNVSHDISVAAQAVILYDLLAKVRSPDFNRGGIGDDPKDISAACISSIQTACHQTMGVMTVSAVCFQSMGRM